MNNEFEKAYGGLSEDPSMKIVMCKCGEVWFCGTHGEYSPGIFNCINPTKEIESINLYKINTEIEMHFCTCKEMLTCSYHEPEKSCGPDHFYGKNIKMLKE